MDNSVFVLYERPTTALGIFTSLEKAIRAARLAASVSHLNEIVNKRYPQSFPFWASEEVTLFIRKVELNKML